MSTFEDARSNWTDEFRHLVDNYENTSVVHGRIWSSFAALVDATPHLKHHRDYIERHRLGFGDRSFHYMWQLIVAQLPTEFSFLEIGVFKGQVVSLLMLLAQNQRKAADVVGVTPLSAIGDKYSSYPDDDYRSEIYTTLDAFELPRLGLTLLCGLSTDDDIVSRTRSTAPYDVVYIDGSHDYEVVCHDIRTFGRFVRPGGFLVMDDASVEMQMPPSLEFTGHADVARAINDHLAIRPDFRHLFACNHNRVWLRVSPPSLS